MFLRIATHVLIDTSLPILLHIIPVLDDTMTNRVVDVVVETLLVGSLVTDVEIEIGDVGI